MIQLLGRLGKIVKKSTFIAALGLLASPALAQQWIGDADYPASALQERREGSVEVELTFDTSGRVVRCDVTRSSGTALLDVTTCRLLLRRARVAAGEPRVRTYEHHWRLPPQS
ncbi:MAG: TonB family protein [Sphingosinicella sp.]|uniref:TonB family protein n=1 Tax=Sphingosinicella sp. TaxID=1917971 RepID=UPI004037CAE2